MEAKSATKMEYPGMGVGMQDAQRQQELADLHMRTVSPMFGFPHVVSHRSKPLSVGNGYNLNTASASATVTASYAC